MELQALHEIKALSYDFDENSIDSVQQHEDAMMNLRRQGLRRPLHSGVTFHIHLNRHDAAYEGTPTTILRACVRFTHTRPRSASTARAQTLPSDHVVLKFIQPSMLTFPTVDDVNCSDEWKDMYFPPKYVASREDDIYHVLHPAQCFAVPYYFGVHQVAMPNGEHAHMLVMEYIPGVCLSAWKISQAHSTDDYQSTLDPTTHAALVPFLQNTTVMALRSLKAIHDLGVLHSDVVFVDLFTAANKNIWPRWFRVERFHCLDAFHCCIQHSDTIRAWLKENLPED
ncbi:hypothetical protein BV25DRAFT_1920992 [Artomyces pyxidatus]|uniref:Uncharacterized protein n=1 Tax=Artomyces pyxidatus TaxID=48021 RepID=A0ACB8SJK9_9AGAM|nr:hypothetical protein BV25DRAFT_1920992 [Artomyces pyxidatus]